MASVLHAPDTTRTYTAEQFLAFPGDAHYELVRGHLRELDMPAGGAHGRLTARLSARITVFVEDNDLGATFAAETGFLLRRDPDTVLAPDFAFVSQIRLPDASGRGFVPAVPDLVLETRSPSDRPRAVADKVAEWLDAGVGMVLELDPQRRRLTVHRPNAEPIALGPDDTLQGSDVLPGFTMSLTRFWQTA